MDVQTCPTCGCLVGDEQTHRNWHASATTGQPVSRDAGPDPDPQKDSDPAPYSA
jgi:hypothetical protein